MSEKFVSKFRFGYKPNLPDLGLRRLLLLKLTPMVSIHGNTTATVNLKDISA